MVPAMRPACLVVLLLFVTETQAAEPVAVDYRRDIRPVLAERCYACHGALAQKAKLRVDSGANMLKAGVIVPGKPDDSPLLLRVSSDDEAVRMPPEGHPLKPEQIEMLRRWIEQGAKVPEDDAEEPDPRDHWAFRSVVRPELPNVQSDHLPMRNPIDRFIAYEWQRRGLVPVKPADPRILLRRVYLDLIGLPPTPEQIEAFLNDPRPDAYERVVAALLSSPHYGERWGRHFLDIWRYSEWWGLGDELRNSQRHIWHWRDWVVESLNNDVGYDEMIRQMLAADELYPTDPQKLRATGYLARPYFLFNRTTWLDEVIEHTGKGFLGLTLNCGKCHDHKYDPFTQNDYYSYRAIFEPYQIRTDLVPGEPDVMKNGIPRVFDANLDAKTFFHIRGDERNPDKDRDIKPGLPRFLAPNGLAITPVALPPEAYQPLRRPEIAETYRKPLAARLQEARNRLLSLELAVAPAGFPFTLGVVLAYQGMLKVEAEQARLEAAIADPSKAPGEYRGTVKTKESNLDSDPQAKPLPETSTGRRSALAKWMTDPSNPLTARVAVNHVWLRHFGKPLVPTIFEFGRRGQPPTHPELLDWLAAEFMAHGWSLKHLHRLIVTSSVYRLSSWQAGTENNLRIDPENRYLWRMNSTRMEAEVVRDSLLHLAGELDPTQGGPPVPMAQQETSRRRSLYLFHSHNDHNKFLETFDAPNVLECYRRTESIVPQQALALWNSKFAMTMAEKILDRLHQRQADADDAAFVKAAFEMILGVPPSGEELSVCLETLEELRKVLADVPDAERTRRARFQIVQALLNHNDFITVR